MSYLLDTHVLIWYAMGSKKLSTIARNIVDNYKEQRLISSASIWEMGIKSSLGKLNLKPNFSTFIEREINLVGYELLKIENPHIFKVEQLPFYHRDPFDRIIISQALTENIPVVSIDANFDLYGVNRIW